MECKAGLKASFRDISPGIDMTWVFVTYRYLAMNVMMVMALVSSLWLIVRYLYDDLMSI
jgi:hypothetical protein